MTERAQALEALKRVARDIGTVKDVASRRSDPDRDNRRMLARLSAWRSEILRALNILEAVPPRPPVGSPTTAHVAPIVGKVWTHHDGVLPDGSVCRTADVDALIAERTAQLQAALFDEQAAHEATKCRLVAAEQSHEAAGNRVIELLKSTPVEPAGAHVETLRQMLRDEEQENTTLRETLQAAWCELIQHDDQPWVKTLAGQVRVVGLFAFPRPQESQP